MCCDVFGEPGALWMSRLRFALKSKESVIPSPRASWTEIIERYLTNIDILFRVLHSNRLACEEFPLHTYFPVIIKGGGVEVSFLP